MDAIDIGFSALVGATASLAANAVWHQLLSPNLVIRDPKLTSIQSNGRQYFWGATIEMVPRKLLGRNPALSVVARLEMMDEKFSNVWSVAFTCRWQGTPQPLVPSQSGYIPSVALIPSGERTDIHLHKPEALDLFLKYDGDVGFYGFCNENYFYQSWRHPGLELKDKVIGARLTVRYGRAARILLMRVRNPTVHAKDFAVEVCSRQSIA